MGSRTLPTECHHGTTIDWGDFGEHQNGCPDDCTYETCPDVPGCAECDAEVEAITSRIAERQARRDALLDALAGHLTWHEGYPWGTGGGKPEPFPGACGACGQPLADHPLPRLYIGDLSDQWAAGRLLADVLESRKETLTFDRADGEGGAGDA